MFFFLFAELKPDHLLGGVWLRREAGGSSEPSLQPEQPGDQQRGHPVSGARRPEDTGRPAEERPAGHRDHHQLPGGRRTVRNTHTQTHTFLTVITTSMLFICHEENEKSFMRFSAFRHEAERLEQEARGKLERQRITDQAEAERARKELLELEALR